jgi:glycosyltransferase involved in cell wall biosynthesis
MLLNTVTHGDIIPWLPDVPTVVWVHEQRALIERLTSRRALRRLARPGCRLVAVSESVRADLVDLLPVRHEDIAVVPPSPAGWPAIDGAVARARLLSEIQATDDPFIVGACGALSWEKSPTGFLDLAETVAAQTGRRVHFAWLGEGRTPDIRRRLDEAASRRGLSCVTFLGAREEPGYFFAALDAFVVVSASDSFPVAALEAARDNTPVVCLADTGGIKEFVRDDAGIVVPGRDARRMAPDIRRLADDGSLCARMGAAGRARVQREHDPGLTAERLMRLFDGHARPPTTMND